MRRAIFNARTFGPFCSSYGVMPRSVACASKPSRDHGLCSMKRWQWSKCPGTYINFGLPESLQEIVFFCIFCQKKRKGRVLFSFSISIGVSIQLCLYFYTANLGIVVHVIQTLGFFLPTYVYAGEDLSVRNQNLEGLLDDVLAKNQLGRTTELPQWSDLLQLSRQTFFCNDDFSATGEVATCFFTFFQNKDGRHFVGTRPESSFCWNLLLFSSSKRLPPSCF